VSDRDGAAEDTGRDRGVRWTRVSRGFYLLGFGTFLLLTTQGILPVSFWGSVLAYWPVLLVAIGIRLLFQHSPAPGLVLLGPVLVLGTLMYVAMREPGRDDDASDWVPVRAEGPSGVSDLTLEGELAMAKVDVTSRRLARGVLAEGRATESGRQSVRVEEDREAGRVRLTNQWHDGVNLAFPGHGARCELGVTAAAPVSIDFDLAFTTTRIDAAAGPVKRSRVDGAFNDMTLRLGEPTEDVNLDFKGAFNHFVIEVPATTPVRVSSDGFLNLTNGRRRNRRPPSGSPGYRVDVEGAFNRLVVRSW
jgi:hypothetical protein